MFTGAAQEQYREGQLETESANYCVKLQNTPVF